MIKISINGTPTHKASLHITSRPHSLKKRLIPIGDTFMGLQGKKYLEFLKGEKNATPRPPVVIASSRECDAVQSAK